MASTNRLLQFSVYVRPFLFFFSFKLRVHQPIIIGKNYTKLYRIIHFIYLTFPISYMRCRCELLYQSKIHILCCVPIHKFSPMNSTHEIQKNTHNQSENHYLFFPKLKEKRVETTSNQTLISLVSFIIYNTWTGSKESLSWWWRWIRRSWKNNHIINLCNFI